MNDRIGEPKTWLRDPDMVLSLLDKLIQSILLEVDPANIKLLLGTTDEGRHSELATRENIIKALEWMGKTPGKDEEKAHTCANADCDNREELATCLCSLGLIRKVGAREKCYSRLSTFHSLSPKCRYRSRSR